MAKLTKADVAVMVAAIEKQLAPLVAQLIALRPMVIAHVEARKAPPLERVENLAKAAQIAEISHGVAEIKKALGARFAHYPKPQGLRVSPLAN